MNLNQIFFGYLVRDQKRGHVLALIALELDDITKLLIFNHGPVATELCSSNSKSQQCTPTREPPRFNNTPRSRQDQDDQPIKCESKKQKAQPPNILTHHTTQHKRVSPQLTFLEGLQHLPVIKILLQALRAHQCFKDSQRHANLNDQRRNEQHCPCSIYHN